MIASMVKPDEWCVLFKVVDYVSKVLSMIHIVYRSVIFVLCISVLL